MEIWRWLRVQWDRAAAAVSFVVGLLGLLLGWTGASGVSLPSEQIPYLASDTVLGLFALGTAATLWLSADLRDEWRSLDQINEHLEELLQRADHDGPSASLARDAVRAVHGEMADTYSARPPAAAKRPTPIGGRRVAP
jgi:hypothetical protein